MRAHAAVVGNAETPGEETGKACVAAIMAKTKMAFCDSALVAQDRPNRPEIEGSLQHYITGPFTCARMIANVDRGGEGIAVQHRLQLELKGFAKACGESK
ncbi:MAG TPA: hypothetical protein VEB03_00920 [Candidatus Nanoarchaeia archaeon]|nr:hypothetical protein [Candidatus Nanoarchaeia archaeon]